MSRYMIAMNKEKISYVTAEVLYERLRLVSILTPLIHNLEVDQNLIKLPVLKKM